MGPWAAAAAAGAAAAAAGASAACFAARRSLELSSCVLTNTWSMGRLLILGGIVGGGWALINLMTLKAKREPV